MNAPPYLILSRDTNAPPIDAPDLLRLERELQEKTGIENVVFLPVGMGVTLARDPEKPEEADAWKGAAE